MFDKIDIRTADQRLADIEAKLDAIIAHLGIGAAGAPAAPVDAVPVPVAYDAADPRGMPEVMACIRQDRLIQAIKAYREITHVGLKEAKDAVDLVAREERGGGSRWRR
jgi:ribosomal protein L7/L12